MTSTTSPQKPAARQTQKGVAKAAAARKQLVANKARVQAISASQKAVEQQVEKAFDEAVKDMSETPEAKAARHQALAVRKADAAAKEAAEQKISPTKRTAKKVATPAKKAPATKSAPRPRLTIEKTKQLPEIEKLAAELSAVEAEIRKLKLSERALADDPHGKTRNELILKLIKLDAGYSFIAKARGIAPSTNRGLCRVLEGGKRL
jgi:hypothetical protein